MKMVSLTNQLIKGYVYERLKLMEKIKLKHIFISTLSSLILLSLGGSIYESFRFSELNLAGIIVFIYYLIPVTLYTVSYIVLLNWLVKKSPFFSSKIVQIVFSCLLVLMLLTVWIIYHGSTYNYFKMSFYSYWVEEVMRYLWTLSYFAISIPLILNFLARRNGVQSEE